MSENKPAKSKELSPKLIYAAATILKERGGELPAREVMDEVEKRLPLDEWARERYEKTDMVRWQVIRRFMSLYATKAGFLVKKKGRWYLTPEGESALKLGERAFDEA